jgi:hypothetical protein
MSVWDFLTNMLGWAENIIGEDLVIEFLGKGVGLVEDSLMEMLDVFGPVGTFIKFIWKLFD